MFELSFWVSYFVVGFSQFLIDLMVAAVIQKVAVNVHFNDSFLYLAVVCFGKFVSFPKMLEVKSLVENAAVFLKSLTKSC